MRKSKIRHNFVAHKFLYSVPNCLRRCMTEETCDRQEWELVEIMLSNLNMPDNVTVQVGSSYNI
jgi:hypothetical protein